MLLVKMNKLHPWVPIIAFISSARASTDPNDVTVLQDLYRDLNYPTQLTGWKYNGGDPCGESWKGVSCNASSVIYMDLSYNNFTGDLSSSFGNLTNLTGLYLRNDQFSGSVIFLANLQLIDLNIQNNHFSGVIPKLFQIGGNTFQIGADYPPWYFSQDAIPSDQNIKPPPATESNAIENYPSLGISEHKRKPFGIAGIAFAVGGVALVATCSAIIVAIHVKRSRVHSSQDLDGVDNSIPTSINVDYGFATPDEFPQSLSSSFPPVLILRHHHGKERKSFSRRPRIPVASKSYSIADLQSDTNFFSEENLVGEGSLGSVFRAEFRNGQILAVKNINTVALSIHEEEQFLDVVSNVARLRHPNRVTLVGYCMEHEQHLLVYEYVKSCSLETALHYNVHKQFNWIVRIKIDLAIARALDYMHSTCSPPVAHCNLKAANILLDNELVPRLSDCGLAVLRPVTSNGIKLRYSLGSYNQFSKDMSSKGANYSIVSGPDLTICNHGSSEEYASTDATTSKDENDEPTYTASSDHDAEDHYHCDCLDSYQLIYSRESNWTIDAVVLELGPLILSHNIEGIREMITPYVGGNRLVRITFEAQGITGETEEMDLDLLHNYHHQYFILGFYAYPFYQYWPLGRAKRVVVELLHTVAWINIGETDSLEGREGLTGLLVRNFGDIPPGSRLLWCSAKGEPQEQEFIIKGGPMWRVLMHAAMKIYIRPPGL